MTDRYPIESARSLRTQRASIFSDLEEGTYSLRDALLKPPVALKGATVYSVLISAEGMGPQTAKKVLLETQIWPLLPLGQLAKDRRIQLIEALPERIK